MITFYRAILNSIQPSSPAAVRNFFFFHRQEEELGLLLLEDDNVEKLYLNENEVLFLRFCFSLSVISFLYVSLLFHETLLFFCLTRCRQKIKNWSKFIQTLTKRTSFTQSTLGDK